MNVCPLISDFKHVSNKGGLAFCKLYYLGINKFINYIQCRIEKWHILCTIKRHQTDEQSMQTYQNRAIHFSSSAYYQNKTNKIIEYVWNNDIIQ